MQIRDDRVDVVPAWDGQTRPGDVWKARATSRNWDGSEVMSWGIGKDIEIYGEWTN